MSLLTHLIGFCKPRHHLFVDLILAHQSKGMDMIARRDGFNPSKPGRFQSPGQDDMPINPLPFQGDCRKTHTHLKGDTRLLRVDDLRSQALYHRFQIVVECNDLWRFALQMISASV